ncbi:uncharacterized protein LOC142326389 [Lycorma delicatula]|uniref:uncharacterized protein LOC142326389 n=1 Tax=Lycorma delicatula TaxID=130591 RepID=UPI003F50DB1F
MASETENLNGKLEVNDIQWSKEHRRENKKLRNAGLEYISRTGKTIAAKKQPEQLCNCPQRCGDKIPDDVRKHLFTEFYKLGDHIQQNHFLQKYIEMRSVRKRLWDDDEQRVGGRLQRRVSCKYHIPIEIEKSKDENNPADVNMPIDASTSGKPETDKHKLSKKKEENTVEVCQKAFMNMYAITEKRIRLQREKLILKSRIDAGMPMNDNIKEGTPPLWTHDLIAELGPLLMNKEILANISSFGNNSLPPDIPTKILLAIDNDISIVSNFFCNQLWKPEYIGCDKLAQNKSIDNNSNNTVSISTL